MFIGPQEPGSKEETTEKAHTQEERTARRLRWGVVCAVVVSLGTWAPNALAEDPVARPDGAHDLYLLPDGDRSAESPVDKGFDRQWSLTLDPSALTAAAGGEAAGAPAEEAPAPPPKGPPLPFYTIEGTGGCLIVPMAYLVNPGPEGTTVGMPSAAYTFVKVGKTKSIQQFSVTQTFYRRIEVGYSNATLDLGNFKEDVQQMFGVDVGDHVTLHNFNVRGLLIEETADRPAVTAGVTFKYNPGVQRINRRLGGALTGLGLERSNGTDFTLTATKTFPTLGFGRPVILNGGIRFSQAAQIGLLGFGDAYRLTGEASALCLLTDWLAIAYEFRQKRGPLGRVGDLVRGEDNWHTVCLGFILSDRLAIACGWGHFGTVANEVEDGVWGFQVKYEF